MATSGGTRASASSGSATKWVLIGVGLAMVAALVLALALGGSDDTTDGSSDGASGVVSEVGAVEVGAVEVEGDALPMFQDPANDPAVGLKAPTVRGRSFDGSTVEIVPGDGRRHMLVFLAHWCPHCQAEVPRLVDWFESGSVPADLEIVGVSTAVTADRPNHPPSAWLERERWPWPVLTDSADFDVAAAYGQGGFPFFMLIDEDGIVLGRFAGEIETEQLEAVLEAAFPA